MFDIQDDYINVVIPLNKEVMEMRGTINGTLNDQEEKVVQAIIVNGMKTLGSTRGNPRQFNYRVVHFTTS